MKDIRRFCSVRLLRVWRRVFAISKPSERRYIGIGISGWLGNGGEAGAVLGSMVGRSDEGYAFQPSYLRLRWDGTTVVRELVVAVRSEQHKTSLKS